MRATVKQFAAAALLVCGLAGALSVAAQSVQITDARGAQVQLANRRSASSACCPR
jgi:iron complex transport system substrate-binding protein